MKRKKVIIFDPVCGIYKGHNLPTIQKYAKWISENLNHECEAWVAINKLPSNNELTFKKIPWVYSYWLYENLSMKDEIKARNRVIKNDSISQVIGNVMQHKSAQNKIEKALEEASNTNPEFIFFPGADFYSLTSILTLAKKERFSKNTIIIVRLMGVMEWATKLPRAHEIIDQVIFDIKILLGNRVRFTAETEKYAFKLSSITNSQVPVTSIPNETPSIIHNKGKIKTDNKTKNTVTLACLGGARPDKGYFDLLNICHKTIDKFNSAHSINIQFKIQSMSPASIEYNWAYQTELSRLSSIKLLKPRLTDEELNSEILASDIIFLPYSEGTYANRGSAILFDTLPFGKPILGVAGTGYGDTIMHAGLGLTYSGIDDYINRLTDLINLSPIQHEKIIKNQREYSDKLLTNLKECFNEQA